MELLSYHNVITTIKLMHIKRCIGENLKNKYVIHLKSLTFNRAHKTNNKQQTLKKKIYAEKQIIPYMFTDGYNNAVNMYN